MKVVIPVFEDCVLTSVIGPMDFLSKANDYFMELYPGAAKKPFEEIVLATYSSNPVINGNFPVRCESTIQDINTADLVIIPAIGGDIDDRLNKSHELVKWLKKQFEEGATLASVCTGSFILAATGLLDNQPATTHWFAADFFRQLYPAVQLESDQIVIDNGRLITSGGATSYLNLCLHLIERFTDKKVANFSARMFLVDKIKHSQLAYAVFQTHKKHGDKVILSIQNHIEKSPDKSFTVAMLAEMASMSIRTFIRKFKQSTGKTPIEYIQQAKTEYIKKQLETTDKTFHEIVYQCGYNDTGHVRSLFKKYTGLTPTDYRKIYVS